MKVLWFSNSYALGGDFINKDNSTKGTGGWMYALNAAIQSEVELSLVFHYPYNISNFQYQKTNYFPVYTGNIIVENFKQRFWGKVYDEDFLESYLKIIHEVNPDIIHIHGTENSFLSILGKTNVPIVISIQGNLTVYHHKFLAGFNGKYLRNKTFEFNLKILLLGRFNFMQVLKFLKKMSMVEQKHLNKAQYIIGRTDWDRRITSVLAPSSKYIIGNEILRNGFYENQWAYNSHVGSFRIFTTNGNNYYKGFETLCHALHLLNNIGLDVEWYVAGVSDNSLIKKITKKQLGCNFPLKGLKLLGSIDENELINNLKKCNAYVMPSHIENSPNNLCEAMILGMPCIATFAGGTSTLLKDGEDGLLVQDGDPWAMSGAIIELIKNPDRALMFAEKARKRAQERHNKEIIINELVNTYNKIITSQV